MTSETNNPLAVEFCGMHFQTPLVLLSGCVGFGEEYTRVEGYSNADVGAICLKGTTGEKRLGNAPHRIYETPGGMLNAIGLQNPGVEKVVDDILPTLDFSETRFIANVSGSTIEEYEAVTRKFDDSPIDAIEINISCPNVKEGGVAFGNDPDDHHVHRNKGDGSHSKNGPGRVQFSVPPLQPAPKLGQTCSECQKHHRHDGVAPDGRLVPRQHGEQ